MDKMMFSMLAALTVMCSAATEFPRVAICGQVVGERADGNTVMTNGEFLGCACRYCVSTNEFGIATTVGGHVIRDFETQACANAFADEFVAAVVKKYGVIFEFSTLDDGRHSYTYRKNRDVSFSVYTQGNCQRYSRGARKNYYTVDFWAHDYSSNISKTKKNVGGVDVRKDDYDAVVKRLEFDPAAAEALVAMSNLIESAQWEDISDGVSVGGYFFGESARTNGVLIEDYFSISRNDPHVLEGDILSTLGAIPDIIPVREWPYELDDVWVYDRVAKGDYTPITGRYFLLRFCEMHPEMDFTREEAFIWTSKIQKDIERATDVKFASERISTNDAEQVSVSCTNMSLRLWINVSLAEDMRDFKVRFKMNGKIVGEKQKRVYVVAQISDMRLWERAKQEAKILQEAAQQVRVPDVPDEAIVFACRVIEAKRRETMFGNSTKTQR